MGVVGVIVNLAAVLLLVIVIHGDLIVEVLTGHVKLNYMRVVVFLVAVVVKTLDV